MRHFTFDLRLADGRTITTEVTTQSWQWGAAFATACARVEADLGIPPRSGIVCVGYRSDPSPLAAAAS